VLLQDDREVAEHYHYLGTPSAVVIDVKGRIATPLSGGAAAIRSLLTRTLAADGGTIPAELGLVPAGRNGDPGNSNGSNNNGDVAHRQPSAGLPIGSPAPEFALPDLSGHTVALTDFSRRDTLLLFWNPGCGFCQQLLPDLKAWEAERPPGAPQLLVISTGDASAHAEMRLASPVLLDAATSVMTSFQVGGTPIALLIDGQGRVASDAAIGGPAVLATLRGRPSEGVVDEARPLAQGS
jgi:peroxiredoxin